MVLSELYKYVIENQTEASKDGTTNTLAYLEACNKLFENGFLSHKRILSMESDVIKSIKEGYEFFTGWMNEVLRNRKCMFFSVLNL